MTGIDLLGVVKALMLGLMAIVVILVLWVAWGITH
jgi:hypothetical protein